MIERREREKERYEERYREGGRDKREEKERERVKERERWKARRVNPTLRLMLSPNYGTRACKKGRGTRTVPSLRGKSSEIMSENYPWIIWNYHWELWPSISSRRKVEIYRDTAVSKNLFFRYLFLNIIFLMKLSIYHYILIVIFLIVDYMTTKVIKGYKSLLLYSKLILSKSFQEWKYYETLT